MLKLRHRERRDSYLVYNVMTKEKDETCAAILREATEDAYKRLIAPAIERLRTSLTETPKGAMKVFRMSLKAASDAAANCRSDCSWLGSGLSYRLQANTDPFEE